MPDRVMSYIDCDLPVEVTLAEWRRARAASSPHRWLGLRIGFPARRRDTIAI
jgi:hypothetical protein